MVPMQAASVYSRHRTLERLSCQLKASRRVDAILDIGGQKCEVSKSSGTERTNARQLC